MKRREFITRVGTAAEAVLPAGDKVESLKRGAGSYVG
jgi:hypothetical protein